MADEAVQTRSAAVERDGDSRALKARRAELGTILTEMKSLDQKYRGKDMPDGDGQDGERYLGLATKAKTIQAELDRNDEIKALERYTQTPVDGSLPTDGGGGGGTETKSARQILAQYMGPEARKNRVVGYMPLGHAFTESKAYRDWLEGGMPREGAPFFVKSLQQPVVPITEHDLETKAVPTIDATVIEPDRLAELVRTTEHDQLVLRDVLNVSRTGSNAVEYVTITSVTRAAAGVAEGDPKPEATMVVDTATQPVRTLAVHMPVTEQQLQDIPQVEGMIENELLYDLGKLEEEQVIFGDGTGQNLLGIMNTSGVNAARTVAGDTNLDRIRRAMTDIRVNGYAPNAVGIHPIDWEDIVLTKGTDDHYLYLVFPTEDGGARVWGIRVVETVATQDDSAAVTTPQRVILVGDYQRGATLWDRMQASVAVGWINDQFIRNMRTLRAEERVAFGVKRPGAFVYHETQAEVL